MSENSTTINNSFKKKYEKTKKKIIKKKYKMRRFVE